MSIADEPVKLAATNLAMAMPHICDLCAVENDVLPVLAAALGYLNHRFVRLPSSIGLTIMGAIASLMVVGLDRALPANSISYDMAAFIVGINFHATLMDGMLSFLLFAGALHVDWTEMRKGR